MGDKRVVYLECGCTGVNHTARLLYFPPSKTEQYPQLYLDLVMPSPKPWYVRLWLAVKYIWKNDDCGYLGFEHVYTREGAEAHIAILQDYVLAERQREKEDGR